MNTIENKFKRYNEIKMDLLKMAKCLDYCDESQKEMYQNICVEYSKELKDMKKSLELLYDVSICRCCFEDK
ncbi:hypothetical protein FH832_003060 [Listeria monocytogenes]|uniref:hypothetical protein n=1 Tax=Priestia TaxID=2800373 RepID=UPI001EBD67F4|nr:MULTISPECIES: hypothetical protein [Priestia]EGI2114993.1 hypothetical protein [Listeria monocytogenes]MCU7712973.1 hypothetical protein [Priestia megaterium]MCW1049034.1 hypothetical protein [Priestia sp. JV24]